MSGLFHAGYMKKEKLSIARVYSLREKFVEGWKIRSKIGLKFANRIN